MRRALSLPRVAGALAVTWAVGCGPSLPGKLWFDGVRLEKATSWERDGISSVVFVLPGETLPSASLQVGILLSRKHASAAELNHWLMDQYRGSPTVRWGESTKEDESCKVGLNLHGDPRPFVALHACRAAEGVAVCAEVDRRLADGDVRRCKGVGWDCWEEFCAERWEPVRPSIEHILDGVLKR
jgi:hypothetical protein